MSELNLIKDRLGRALHGGAWHGDSICELLEGISPEQAASYPIKEAHSIWEIVLHLACWHRVVKRRLRGGEYEPADRENWPSILVVDDPAWRAAQEDLYQSTEDLILEMETTSVSGFDQLVTGKTFTVGIMLHGVVEHDLYHAGQIAMLKKLL